MAITKGIDTPFGVGLKYHRIVSMSVLHAHRVVDVSLGSYVDQDARDAGKAPMSVMPAVRLSFEDVGDEPTRATVYAALKERPEFVGALDC